MQMFGALEDATAETILTALESAPGDPPSREALVRAVTSAGPELDAEGLVDALLTLEASRETASIIQISEDVAESEDLALAVEQREGFTSRLRRALAAPAVMNLGRAYDVLIDRDKLFTNARIITDIRPIFSDDVNQTPVGVALVHTLKLSAVSDGRREIFYFALDVQDLDVLREAVKRADDKTATLRAWIAKTGLPCVDPGVE
jgi:hypothetical protein